MLKAVAPLFNRHNKHSRPFKDYYSEWFSALKNNLLPLLRRSISGDSPTILSTNVEMLHQHFQSYYYALDAAASSDPYQLLHQPWRNSLEKPLLWLGDLHPFLFTNLARSFLDEQETATDDDDFDSNNRRNHGTFRENRHHYGFFHENHHDHGNFQENRHDHGVFHENRPDDVDFIENAYTTTDGVFIENRCDNSDFLESRHVGHSGIRGSFDLYEDRPWQVAMAWRNPSDALTTRMDQIECGLRVIVPTLTDRMKHAEGAFVDRVVGDWFNCRERKGAAKVAVGADVKGHMEELVSIFLYANRLRRSVLVDIMSAASVYQAALFLEGLAQFLIGFRDHELVHAVEQCKTLSIGHNGKECRSMCH